MTGNIGKMAEIIEIQGQTQATRSSLLLAEWKRANAKIQPMNTQMAIFELGQCLTLCAPVGMRDDERANWLTIAYSRVSDIPAAQLSMACAAAMDNCDHPAKIVPFIVKHSQEMTDLLHKIERGKRRQYENINAPRLQQQETEQPAGDRDEVAAMLHDLTNQLKAAQ